MHHLSTGPTLNKTVNYGIKNLAFFIIILIMNIDGISVSSAIYKVFTSFILKVPGIDIRLFSL